PPRPRRALDRDVRRSDAVRARVPHVPRVRRVRKNPTYRILRRRALRRELSAHAETLRTFLWHAHIGGVFPGPVRAEDEVIRMETDVPRGSLRRGQRPHVIIYGV